jgi:hypothetical protein
MPRRASLQCPNCGAPIQAIIETVIDPARDPNAKTRLLSGRANAVQCSNCGATAAMATPLLYHDSAKELLLTFVPMELNLSKEQSERAIGEMMKELTGSLKPEQMRGYLFQPRQMLTLQGMIDTILQADGVTPQMMEEQRARVRLLEELLNTPPDMLAARVAPIDAQIDEPFMQMMGIMAQRVADEGQMQLAQALIGLQERLVELTSYGKTLIARAEAQQATVQAVADDLNALPGAQAGQVDFGAFADLALRYAEDDQRLQALVGIARAALDTRFFDALDGRINAAQGEAKAQAEAVRTRIQQLTAMVDQQANQAVSDATAILQALVSAPDLDDAIAQSLPLLDETFMAVLGANIQEAERRADIQASARLKGVYEAVMRAVRGTMPPELMFINDLLASNTPEEARARVQAEAGQYGPALLEMLDSVETAMASRGQEVILQRLAFLRSEITAVVGQAGG